MNNILNIIAKYINSIIIFIQAQLGNITEICL